MDYDFDINGIDELEAALRQLDDGLERHIVGRGLLEMAKVVSKRAKEIVPRRTGALAASIRPRRAGDRFRGRKIPGAAANVFSGGPGARHAALIELGTVNAPAQPYIAPALTSTRSEQQAALVKGSSRELVRQVRRIAAGTQSRSITRLISGG